jgi:glycosyltransferase involved in cell wall biosynthesis
MKVALIVPSLLNRGPIVFTRYLANSLTNIGVGVSVFYIKPLIELSFSCPIQKLNLISTRQLIGFDIVNTTMLVPDFYGMVHRRNLSGRWVVSIHNEIGTDLRYSYSKAKAIVIEHIWKESLEKCKNIITSSKPQLNYYSVYLNGSKNYGLIGYGINRTEPNELVDSEKSFLLGIKRKYKLIGSCGLLIPRKGYSQLVKILIGNPDYAVVIIGFGECYESLIKMAVLSGVQERFHILGYKKNHIDYYPYFDVYASTSYSEGFGLAMIEAISLGIPIVCTRLKIYDEYFNCENVGLFEPDNIVEMGFALKRVFESRGGYSLRSSNMYSSKFSAEVMARNHLLYYQKILDQKVV